MDNTKGVAGAGEMASEAKNGAIVQAKPEEGALLFTRRDLSLEAELKKVERDVAIFKGVQRLALRLTAEADWILQAKDAPYLMDRGAEKIGIAFGVDVSGLDVTMEWQEDTRGRYYQFIAQVKAFSRTLGRYVEDQGVSSQRDEFFGVVQGELKPVEQIDMTDIRKKAITNAYGRVIKRVIGLIGVTAEDLREAGLDVGKIKSVERREGGQKSDKDVPPVVLEKRKEVWALCLELGNGQQPAALEILKKVTEFPGEKGPVWAKDIRDLRTMPWTEKALGRLLDLKAGRQAQAGGQAQAKPAQKPAPKPQVQPKPEPREPGQEG